MDNVKKNEATPQPERAAGLPERWKEAAAIYREQGRNDIADVFDDCAYALARQQSRMADAEYDAAMADFPVNTWTPMQMDRMNRATLARREALAAAHKALAEGVES